MMDSARNGEAIFDFDDAPPPLPVPKPAPKVKKPEDGLLLVLEREIRRALRDKELKSSDRVKLIEAGAKLLAVRHKIEGGGDAGGFFANK